MVDTAPRRMSIPEFLNWNAGDDRRYQLVAGSPVAMTPPAGAHGILAVRLARHLDEAVERRPPSTARAEVGIVVPLRSDTLYQADLAVTCQPHEAGERVIADPGVIIEVLSPSTEDHDRKVKLPDYRTLASVQEIVLIDSERIYCEVHRRFEGDRWLTELLRDGEPLLQLTSIGLDVPLARPYAGVAFKEE